MSVTSRDASLCMLLAHVEGDETGNADTIDPTTLALATKPRTAPRAAETPRLADEDAATDDLRAQGWAIVVREGGEGDRLLEAIAPLVALRREELGAEVEVIRLSSDMDASATWSWKKTSLLSRPEQERPRYLLLLGDLDQLSLELQQVLQNGSFVGRLAGAADSLRKYAEKIVREAAREARPPGEALFFVARDGTPATELGAAFLADPCFARASQEHASGERGFRMRSSNVAYEGDAAKLLEHAAGADARLLLSVSHGLGAGPKGWTTPEEARAWQGALVVGKDLLTAIRLRDRVFVPGGLWFSVACFSAAVPAASVYYAWLKKIEAERGPVGAADALRSLSHEQPFLSAMPLAALENPDGPIAFIGHADLAWTFAFRDAATAESRAERILACLRSFTRGQRVGAAFNRLVTAYQAVNDALLQSYQDSQDAIANGDPDPENVVERGTMWMTRNDLRGYVLLGDPAARTR